MLAESRPGYPSVERETTRAAAVIILVSLQGSQSGHRPPTARVPLDDEARDAWRELRDALV